MTMDANLELKRIKEWAWMRGFANMYKKESRAWWTTKRWWINGLLWSGLGGGMMAFILFLIPAFFCQTRSNDNSGRQRWAGENGA
jgi:hypothetical protein